MDFIELFQNRTRVFHFTRVGKLTQNIVWAWVTVTIDKGMATAVCHGGQKNTKEAQTELTLIKALRSHSLVHSVTHSAGGEFRVCFDRGDNWKAVNAAGRAEKRGALLDIFPMVYGEGLHIENMN